MEKIILKHSTTAELISVIQFLFYQIPRQNHLVWEPFVNNDGDWLYFLNQILKINLFLYVWNVKTIPNVRRNKEKEEMATKDSDRDKLTANYSTVKYPITTSSSLATTNQGYILQVFFIFTATEFHYKYFA